MFADVKFTILFSDGIFDVNVLLTVSERKTLMILSMTAKAVIMCVNLCLTNWCVNVQFLLMRLGILCALFSFELKFHWLQKYLKKLNS